MILYIMLCGAILRHICCRHARAETHMPILPNGGQRDHAINDGGFDHFARSPYSERWFGTCTTASRDIHTPLYFDVLHSLTRSLTHPFTLAPRALSHDYLI